MMGKTTHGGVRQGSGRPKSEPTETVSFRLSSRSLEICREKYKGQLNKMVRDFIDKLADSPD